jgi:serine/threonine protein kinase
MAPEMVALTGYNVAVDAWAFGVLLCEMLTGMTPFLPHGLESKNVQGNIVPYRIQYSDATILAAIADTQVS